MIRKNLHDFLHAILQGHETRQWDEYIPKLDWFWADQISIDQSNLDERNHQVDLMDTIYTIADVVYAYTGPDSPDARIALNAMFPQPGTAPVEGREIETVVENFCKRDYWYRLWIVQELHVARRVIFWCGSYGVASHEQCPAGILDTGKFATRKTRAGQHVIKVRQMQSGFRIVSTRAKRAGYMSLSRAVVSFSDQLCEDIRDKIFGLQALVHYDERIQVDYSLTAEQVFDRSIKNFIQHYRRPKTFTDMRCFQARTKHWDFDIMCLTKELLGLHAVERMEPPLQTLCWAHWILHMHRDKALNTGTDAHSSWETALENVCEYAVTQRQKLLAEALSQRFENHVIHDPDYQSLDESSIKATVDRVAEDCGFVEVDRTEFVPGFLMHTEDEPLSWHLTILKP